MKKICIVTTVSITLKSFVVETAKHLYKECGYDVTLICNNDEEFAKSLPEYLHYIPVHMIRGVNLSGLRTIRNLKKIFRKEKFDMVQYATPNASLYASIAAKSTKVPIRLYCQWGIRYVGFSGIKRLLFKFLEKKVCKNSTNIFAVSKLNKQFAVEEKLYSEAKAIVVGNGGTIGVDTSVYDITYKSTWREEIRKKYAIEPTDIVYGFVGRLSIDKGACELIKAFKAVVGEQNVKLMIVGWLENSGIENYEIEYLKTSPDVVLTGAVDGAVIKKYYAAFDVLVHPTYREGFGMVLQEAGAMGVPSITTKIPGASEVMVDKESCLLIEPRNVEELKDAMLLLKKDRGLLENIGKAAYERTLSLYERKIMLENQRQAYQELLK